MEEAVAARTGDKYITNPRIAAYYYSHLITNFYAQLESVFP
jgi:hypothetical protein